MNKSIAIKREKSVDQAAAAFGNDKLAVGVIGVASLLIGCWAVACLVAGSIASGGPGGLVANLLSALS